MIPLAVGGLAIVSTLIGAGKYVDARYELREHPAYELKDHADRRYEDDERSRLESQLEVYELKLSYLMDKSVRSAQDEAEIKYLEDVISKIRQRLKGLG